MLLGRSVCGRVCTHMCGLLKVVPTVVCALWVCVGGCAFLCTSQVVQWVPWVSASVGCEVDKAVFSPKGRVCVVVVWSMFALVGDAVCKLRVGGKHPLGSWIRALCEIFQICGAR